MSLLIKVQRETRIVNGDEVKIGDTCRLPDDLATVLCQKGYAVLADGSDHIKESRQRKLKKESSKEKKKRGRPAKE